MLVYLFDFLFYFSIVFEICALILALSLNYSRIFLLTLALILAKFSYLNSSIYQANIFIFLFLPLIFWILCFKKEKSLIFERENLISFCVLFVFIILALILPHNLNFISILLDSNSINFLFFKPINSLALLFFMLIFVLLCLKTLKSKENYILLAFVLTFVQFFFQNIWAQKHFEFASLLFCFYILQNTYKLAFYDDLTKLGNFKKLSHHTKGKKYYIIALLHFDELYLVQESYKKLILKQIAKILKRLKTKIFIKDEDFILIFKNQNTALDHLAYLESLLKNTELKIENEKFKPSFKIAWKENKNSLEQDLKSLREKFL